MMGETGIGGEGTLNSPRYRLSEKVGHEMDDLGGDSGGGDRVFAGAVGSG